MSWPKVKLGEIFEIARGGSPRPISEYISDAPNAINWISIKDATGSSKYIYKTKLKIKPEGIAKSRLVKPGDFLLTNSMSFGHPYILKTEGCIHDGWLVLSDSSTKVNQDYFYHLLGSPLVYHEFLKRAAGAVVKNLNIDLVRSVEIPLPPLDEQRHIAAILDKADSIRKKRREAIALADEFLRSAFLDMFGDPVTNPKGWEVKKLIQWINPKRPITYGILKPGPDIKDGIPYVRVVDMNSGTVDVGKVRRTTPEIATAYKRSSLLGKDLLMSIRGHVGRLSITPQSLAGANITQDTTRLAPNKKEDLYYLFSCLDSKAMQFFMKRFVKGVAVKGINLGDVKELPIPIPPRKDREKWMQIFVMQRKSDDGFKRLLIESDNLFNSLTQRAFRGEL